MSFKISQLSFLSNSLEISGIICWTFQLCLDRLLAIVELLIAKMPELCSTDFLMPFLFPVRSMCSNERSRLLCLDVFVFHSTWSTTKLMIALTNADDIFVFERPAAFSTSDSIIIPWLNAVQQPPNFCAEWIEWVSEQLDIWMNSVCQLFVCFNRA